MNIDELKELIESSLNDDKTFELETEGLADGLEALGTDYFADGSLKLSNAEISASGESITVTGTGTDMPFKGLAVKAEFYILDDNPALELTAATGKDWKFENSIAEFKGTIANDLRFKAEPAPVFYLLSDERGTRPKGLTFEATIDLGAMTGGLKDLLGVDDREVSGPIILEENGSKFVSIDLKGKKAIAKVSIGVVDILRVEFGVTSHIFDTETEAVAPCISLVANLPFKGKRPEEYQLPISANLKNLSSAVRFNAGIGDLVEASLEAVAALAGGVKLDKILPVNFKIGEYIEFTGLYIDYSLKEKKAEKVGLKLESASEWEILRIRSGKSFNARDIVLQYTITDPLNTEKRAEALNVSGELTVTDKAGIAINAAYPDFNVEGSLAGEEALSIKDFIKKFVGEDKEVPATLVVNELNFNTTEDDYSFDIKLSGDWDVDAAQSSVLTVKNLSFEMAYVAEDDDETAAFSGVITVDNVDITVTADYAKDEEEDDDEKNDKGKDEEDEEDEKGWVFNGSTGEDQKISMGNFIAYLTRAFRAGDPPDWVKSIALSDLHAQFNTQTKYFEFGVKGNIAMGDERELDIAIDFDMTKGENGYQKELSGEISVSDSDFAFKVSAGETNVVSAEWTAAGESGYLKFTDITSAFGLGALPPVPSGLELDLKKAKLKYNFDDKAFIFSANSGHYGESAFAAKLIDEEWVYMFSVNMSMDISLRNLPLVGPDLVSVVGDASLKGFKLIGVSGDIDEEQIAAFNEMIEDAGEEYPTLPDSEDELLRAVYVIVELKLGEDDDYKFEFDTAKKEQLTLLPASGKDDGMEKWVDLQKNIGPIHFNRAGVAYKDGRVSLLLDAALVFSALDIELLSLGVSNPLNKFKPDFELSGINISYESGPVQISGGFLKSVVGDSVQYSGTAAIGVQNFRLSALGSYTEQDGEPSLFIFATLSSPPPGGPPCFFVTKLAGGFGYNRSLKLPTIDTVADFPLVQAFAPGGKSPFDGDDPNRALEVLNKKKIVPVAIGQNWVAAGVQFTSFQQVLSYALLSVEFGTNVEIGIIGMSSISVPPDVPSPSDKTPKKPATPVAFAQMALNARILPEKGEVAIEAKLTPASFILSKKCVLSGGFAFYLWTAPNEHEGDFVVTLGGYHPDFKIPAHYPKVPRLGFNWEVSKEVLVKGSMYFALTPTCLMAGGSLEATFTSGNLKAWFIMGADFLIAWKPYYYRAHMYISFGVSYTFELDLLFTTITETISVSLGADLQIWGPDFSGTASIHLWIISFDISFGSAANGKPDSISWKDFRESFLPSSNPSKERLALYVEPDTEYTDTYCYSKVTNGLVKQFQPEDKKNIDWIVNREQTVFETSSTYPSKHYSIIIKDSDGKDVPFHIINNEEKTGEWNKDFGVGMVDVESKDFHSTHTVIINLDQKANENQRYEVEAILRSIPKALWLKRDEPGFDEEGTIENVLVGFRIIPTVLQPSRTLPVDLKYFKFSPKDYQPKIAFTNPVFVKGPDGLGDGLEVMKKTINTAPVQQTRDNLIAALKKRNPKFNPKINVAEIAEHAEDAIMAAPVLSYTYWKKSA